MKDIPNYANVGSRFEIPGFEQLRLWSAISVENNCWVWIGDEADIPVVRKMFFEQAMCRTVTRILLPKYYLCDSRCVNWKHIREYSDPSKAFRVEDNPPPAKPPLAVRRRDAENKKAVSEQDQLPER